MEKETEQTQERQGRYDDDSGSDDDDSSGCRLERVEKDWWILARAAMLVFVMWCR